jgi:hypothetical protein
VCRQTAGVRWLGATPQPLLEREKKELQLRVETAETFLASRVDWAAQLHGVVGLLPPSLRLSALQGECPLGAAGSGAPGAPGTSKRSFTLAFSTPMPGDGAMPREIDGFLEALRQQPVLTHDFPLIKVTDLQRDLSSDDKKPGVSFRVMCLPGAGPAAPKPTTGGRGKAAE